MFEDMSEGHCLHVLRGSLVNQKVPPNERLAWTYRIMLTLDLFHITLAIESRYRDEPDRYMKAMTICAAESRCVNTSVVRESLTPTHDMGVIFKYRLGKATPALFVCRKAKVSGRLSSLRVEKSTSAMRSLVRPTQILNSFMLHGCSELPG